MIAGVIVSLLVTTAAVAFVVAPLMRKDAAEAERVALVSSEAEELQSRREMLLAALKDLEDDRVTNKIDNEDYAELQARLTAQAVEVMKRIDAMAERSDEPRVRPD